MYEFKLALSLSVALLISIVVAGCGSSRSLSNTPTLAPGTTNASPSPSPAPNSTTITDIQNLGGWQSCTGTCTSTGTAVYAMHQEIASPSLSGSSARFQLLSRTQPFGAALWFKYLGSFDSATHFVYDLWFYVDNPSASQALEFGASQSTNGNRYNFSAQCLLAGQNVWRVWNPEANAWSPSSATCTPPAANTWNHLVWEFQRDSSGNAIFNAVTLNGSRQAVNLSMAHTSDSTSGLDVFFQPDANASATPYTVWLDKISVTYW